VTLGFWPIRDGDVAAVVELWRRCGLLVAWNDPQRDIAFARSVANAEVILGDDGGKTVASVMVGLDGKAGGGARQAVRRRARHRPCAARHGGYRA